MALDRDTGDVKRRAFLRAGAAAGAAAGLALTARLGTAHPRHPDDRSRTATGTASPTPTPTDAVSTPSTGFDPLGTVAVPDGTETVVAPDGETAFVAVGDGFAVVDLTDPIEPAVAHVESPVRPAADGASMTGIRDVKYDDGTLLVAGPAGYDPRSYHGVVQYDVDDPTSPVRRAAHRTTFPVHNCYLADGIAYLTGNQRRRVELVVVDLRAGTELARWSVVDHDQRWADVWTNLRTLHDVWVHDGLAYLAHWDAGTWILDVSDPSAPEYVANVTQQSPETLATLSNVRAARAVAQPPGNDHYVATDEDGTLMAIGKESWDSGFGEPETTPTPQAGETPGTRDPGGPSGIHLYDVSDPATPRKLAEISPPPTADPRIVGPWTTAHNFDLQGGYLYSSWYRGGVRVHDVSDPANPVELEHYRHSRTSSFWTAQLARAGDFLVATSHENPQHPEASGTVYTFPDPRPDPTATPSPTRSPTDAGTTDPPTTDSGTTDPPTTRSPTDETPPPGTSADGPGFGPLAALAGLGVAGWRALASGSEDDGPSGGD